MYVHIIGQETGSLLVLFSEGSYIYIYICTSGQLGTSYIALPL
jgi:hypothetical protein